MTIVSIDANIIHFTIGFVVVGFSVMILSTFRETIQYFGNRILYWICRLMNIPMVGEYYIQTSAPNPYHIGKYWYIIPQGGDIDVDHSPRYLALSIALINHDL